MDIWKYYDGDLKYPNVTMYSHEKEIAKANPKWAFDYVSKHGKDKELESIIAKDAYYSYQYAIDILEGPFNLGEPAIAKNPYYSFNYAKHILKGEFPLGEPAIAKDAYYSKEYTNVVLKKDFYLDGKLICKYEG
jgi:hypothetical protein